MTPLFDIGIGLFDAFLGALARFLNAPHLLAGYDPSRVQSPGGLVRWSGGRLMLAGAILVAGGLGQATHGARFMPLQWQLFAATIAVQLPGAQRY